jgi:hypothetical protein
MRVQYTKSENESIEFSRKENKNFDGIIIPVEGQGQEITLGLEITDVHKFNMFVASWITDQGKEESQIANEIGANIIHIDYRPPIKTEYLLFLKNYIDGILFGPTPDPAPEEGEQQVLLEEGESVTITTPQTESGLIVDDSVSPIAEDSTPE